MNLDKIRQPFTEIFPGDFSGNLQQRQTPKVLFSTVETAGFPNAELLLFNEELAQEIGLEKLDGKQDEEFLAGNYIPPQLKTYATAYAGHQFGNWAGQLGDGRAIFAGEIENSAGKKTELQWKGAGATPYSRHADGRAVLRSTIREYLMSEAFHFLRIPTTRALSLSLSGEEVVRDMMYNGNVADEKGAVMIRTAESFLRFGHFELLSARKETSLLQKLTDFSVENYFPGIQSRGEQKYKDFFEEVARRTAELMVEWFRVGFVHGVMNTDNMSLLGLTIDYGPYSMLDEYDLNFTSNTTDLPGRRYAFGKQAQISQWNLWQLANALFPLIKDEKFLEQILNDYSSYFWEKHDEMLAHKFGFEKVLPGDEPFFTNWQHLMHDLRMDYTLFFAELEKWNGQKDISAFFGTASYAENTAENRQKLLQFLHQYESRTSRNQISPQARLELMQENNPKFILRNYLLYECIAETEAGGTDYLHRLLHALKNPYQEPEPEFMQKRPAKYDSTPGCSMLSCSS